MIDDKCCLGCTERHYLCHSTCERHKRAKEKHDAAIAVIKRERAKLNDLDGVAVDGKIKAKKRRGDR